MLNRPFRRFSARAVGIGRAWLAEELGATAADLSRSPNTAALMPAETGPLWWTKAAICSSVGALPVVALKKPPAEPGTTYGKIHRVDPKFAS